MRTLKLFAVAFALATGTFLVTMLKDPPKSVAADPSVGFSIRDIKVPTDIPTAEGGNAF